jgi:inner membrane protein
VDNLTHTVIGLVAGETVARSVKTRHRVPLLVVGMVGGNLPDSDLLVSYSDGPLGYLLQHRGYTHTLIGCFALALLLFAACLLWLRLRREPVTRAEVFLFAGMSVLAVALHLAMDSLNSYGVHPYWPFDNHWHYGDSVFIVEPWYWIAAAPLLFVIRSLTGRIALGVLLLVAPVASLVLSKGRIGWPLGIAIVTAALVYAGRKVPARFAAWGSTTLMVCVTLGFVVAGQGAARKVEALALQLFPGETLVDHVLEPLPTNPFCWDFLLLQRDSERYVARYGVLALGRGAGPEACARVFQRLRGTAPWKPLTMAGDPRVGWFGELSMPLDRLPGLVAGRCELEALMQFVRAPYATQVDGHWVVGDLRFDREPGLGLAEIAVDDAIPARCPRSAPWIAPRADLLRHSARMGRAGE